MSAVHEAQFQVFLAAVAVVGAILFVWGFAVLKEKLLFQNIPRSSIRSLAMGLCEVSGQATTASPLKAPFSGTSCVYYSLRIVKNPSSNDPVTLAVEEQRSAFCVFDGTGVVRVDPHGAELVGTKMTFSFSGSADRLPDVCQAYIEQRGLSEKVQGFISPDLSLEEWSFSVGQPLFVLGAAVPPGDGDRDRYRAVFGLDRTAPVFLISAESQKDYLADLNRGVWLGLVGGPLLTLGCLALLLLSL